MAISEARRLRNLYAENSGETGYLVSRFQGFSSEATSLDLNGYPAELVKAGLSSVRVLWLPVCFALTSVIGIFSGVAFGNLLGFSFALAYIIFHFRFIPSYLKSRRRISAVKDIPFLLAAIEQASSAGKTINSSLDASIEALPSGVLKRELRDLRDSKGTEGCLKLIQRISGREIQSLVGGLAILLATSRPDIWQIREFKSRVEATCSKVRPRMKRYRLLTNVIFFSLFFVLGMFVVVLSQVQDLKSLELMILAQLVGSFVCGFLAEEVLRD